MSDLKAPFPWFGGKRKVAPEVWRRFGDVKNYVEPFFGSGAVMLARPQTHHKGIETVNDLDGFVSNFWRSLRLSFDETAEFANQPVNENDLHARHVWLVERRETLRARLEGDPDYYDPQIAGWWAWGLACWIGSGWCAGKGPWWVDGDHQLIRRGNGNGGQGVNRKLPHLGDGKRGVNLQPPHLGPGVYRKLPYLGYGERGVNWQPPHLGPGVYRQLPYLGYGERGVNWQPPHLGGSGSGQEMNRLLEWFGGLSSRLRNVRVASGDWTRVCGPAVTFGHGMTGVFLDPPYSDGDIDYISGSRCSMAVRKWAVANGNNPLLRIALCGYQGEHEMPASWAVHRWDAGLGYGNQAEERTENGSRERIWFSPACLAVSQGSLF